MKKLGILLLFILISNIGNSEIITLFERGDSHTINGMNAMKLGETQAVPGEYQWNHDIATNAPHSFVLSIYIRHADGSLTILEEDIYVWGITPPIPWPAVHNYSDVGWVCPDVDTDPTDAIMISRRIIQFQVWPTFSPYSYWISNQLGATALNSSEWRIMHHDVKWYFPDPFDAGFYWGDYSRIENIQIELSPPPVLNITPTSHNSSWQEDSFDITVTSNSDWTILADQNWINTNIASGSGDDIFTVTISENNEYSFRTGTVSVELSNGEIECICDINQWQYENTYSIEVTSVEGEIGDTLSVYIMTSEIPEANVVTAYQFEITYDSSVVEFIDFEMDNTISDGGLITTNDVAGTLSIAYMTSSVLNGEGVLLELQFEGISEGSSDLILSEFLYNSQDIGDLTNGNIIVTPGSINNPPTIELPESFSLEEDAVLEEDFYPFIEDIDGDELILSVAGNEFIQVLIDTLSVTFIPDENWYGTETITFTVDDQQGRATASDDVVIIVTSVNDLPIADAGEEYSGQADVTGFCEIMLNGSGSYDIDGEILSWQWTWEGRSAEGEEVSAEFPTGTTEITLTVSDNEAGIDTDITQIVISSYENQAPVAIVDEYTLNEDTELSDNVMTNDYDPDEFPQALTAELISGVSNGTLDFADNGDFTYLPDPNWNGTDAFSYRVYDEEDYSETVIATLIVNPINDAPTIELPDSFTFAEDDSLEVDFSEFVDDVDNEVLLLSDTGGLNIITEIVGLNVTFTASENWFGSEILTFTIDDQQERLTASDSLLIIVESGCEAPEWSINSADYEYNGSIWGIVFLNDIQVEHTNGILGCFVGAECRGIAAADSNTVIDYSQIFGHIAFLPMIHSNFTSGEMITFKYWDPIECDIYNIFETFEFTSDMEIGNGIEPFEFHASTITPVDISIDMIPGWNWLSLNIVGDDMSVNNVLSSLDNNAASIKSQTQSALYYDGMGWFGSLTDINNITFYKLNALNNVTWEYTGLAVDSQSMIYSLITGWNWISYAPQEAEEINYALASIEGSGANIKSQTQSSIYYEGIGWYGSLTQLQPLDGYMLNMNEPDTLIYPTPLPMVRNEYSCPDIYLADTGWKVDQ
ncbi:MAG: Ig-like domain-containing protein, partial [Candidatus Stygibacter australis]|nr:Ig-like domain-containing protein [Candidatus Stygibacter australis]